MHEQVGFARLVEGRFERLDEVGREFANEADGVGQQEGQVAHHDFAHRRVEGGEELVFGKDVAFGQQVEEGRFSDVGVADERHAHHFAAILSLGAFLLVDFGESFFEERHAVEDDAAVHFELCFARAAQSHAAAFATAGTARSTTLALKVRPQALQAREHVAVLCQLYLCFGIGGLGSHGEDVEDERGAVENLDLQRGFDVAELFGREFVVEDHHAHGLRLLFVGRPERIFLRLVGRLFAFFDVLTNLFELAFAHIGDAAGAVDALGEAAHSLRARRFGEKLQFVEIFVGLPLVLRLGDESDQDGGFGTSFGVDEFFHVKMSVLLL